MKMQGIISNAGLSFTLASVATFLGTTANVQPLQHYLVEGEEWFLKPDTNGAYTAPNGGKYALVKSADYAQVKVGTATYDLTRASNIVEFEDGTGITAALSNGKVSFSFGSGTASNGKVLTANGTGGYTFETPQAYEGSTTDTSVTSVVAGVIGTAVKVNTAATNNILQSGVDGLSVGLAGSGTNSIDTTYDINSHVLTADLRLNPANDNRASVDFQGLYVKQYKIGANSTGFATIDQATGEIDITARTIITQHTVTAQEIADTPSALATPTGADWLANNAASYEEGDMVMIPSEATSWVRTATASGAGVWEQVLVPSLTDAGIRSKFDGQNGVALDQNTGVISGVVDPTTTGLSVGADGFAFDYTNVAVIDTTGISGSGTNYAMTLHAYLVKISESAKKMFDTTATQFYLSGTVGSTAIIKKFYLDSDGALACDTYTGGGDYPN